VNGNGLSKNVQLIDLGKAMKQLEDEADEYKGVHRGEAAGGEYHWDKGTREIWQAKRKEIKELRLRAEALRMD
jgi:hypothetical protein